MSFISYAQHGEDVMLMRALKHVEHGFYIDVGANHPSEDSVTKAFYDRGWRGLNIEPLPEHIAQLRAARLRDINLQVAAGASEGEITLYNTPVRGLATASAEVAQRHASQGLATSASVVSMRPLADICAQYVAGQDIHFLKIDVGGFETDVLQGMDFQRFRPWIVLVEAILPNAQQISADWEPLVVNAGYRKVFFDGLNRYYIAEEHPELADAFAAPPNVFDGYITAKELYLHQELAAIQQATEQIQIQAAQAQAALRAELDRLFASKSWQFTRPLRVVMNWLRQLRDQAYRAKSVELLLPSTTSAQHQHDISPPLCVLPTCPTQPEAMRAELELAHAVAPARQAWQASWAAAHGKQLLVDVSELYHRDARTGIQRVVRSVLNELFRAPPAGYVVCPVYASQGEPFRYTDKFAPHGAGPQDEQPIRVSAGDIFLGLDLAAHLFPEVESQLAAFRLAGAQVHYVVYDIIPLRYPHLTVAGISEAFTHWLSGLARHADGLMCISDAVAQDVRHWLLQQHPALPLPAIGHFHLGADLDQSTPSTGLPDDAASTLANLDAHTSFLMVGTIEPRKGHALVLEAFELLWAAGLDCRLVLVGKAGWNITELAERLRQHAEYRQRLIWLESASDEYLEKIYRHTDCLIAASECEGFGLPLIEAAQHDLPILARDIAVFREVAGEYASYFRASQPDALAQSLRDWLDSYAIGGHPRSGAMPWLTWQASTQALLHAVLPPRSTE